MSPDLDAGPVSDASASFDAGLPFDGGTSFACDPVRGDGCPAPLRCRLIEVPRCAELPDAPAGFLSPCTPGACDEGLVCIRATETATVGRCAQICEHDSGAGCERIAGDWECRARLEALPWGLCTELPPLCNPYNQRPCPVEEACQPFLRRTGSRELRCQPAGPRQGGEACGSQLGNCARGWVCIADPTGGAVCRKPCELNQDCPRPEQCTGWVEEPELSYCLP